MFVKHTILPCCVKTWILPLNLRDEHALLVLENEIVKKYLGVRKKKFATRGERELHEEELHKS